MNVKLEDNPSTDSHFFGRPLPVILLAAVLAILARKILLRKTPLRGKG